MPCPDYSRLRPFPGVSLPTPLSFLDAAARVLHDANEPLHYRVITEQALAKDLVQTQGKTPADTMNAQISVSIKSKGDASRFVRVRPGIYGLRTWVEENLGLTLGIGLGMAAPGDPAWHGFFRLGHMGHVNGHMILGLLGGIDAGLKALEIPHGDGALEAASRVIAGA